MKRKVIIVVCILSVIVIALFVMYEIDMYMMKNNKPVIFSTWGYDYAPPENGYQVLEIVDMTKDTNYTCDTALEKIYEDDKNEYYFNCIKSQDIIVKYVNGERENIKSALKRGSVSLKDLGIWEIRYITKVKKNIDEKSFVATVLKETATYIMVRPDANESEAKSADKIVVSLKKENQDYFYGVGKKVKIYYDGIIMESYPAQINAHEIYIVK